jgi:hypothetical protein
MHLRTCGTETTCGYLAPTLHGGIWRKDHMGLCGIEITWGQVEQRPKCQHVDMWSKDHMWICGPKTTWEHVDQEQNVDTWNKDHVWGHVDTKSHVDVLNRDHMGIIIWFI